MGTCFNKNEDKEKIEEQRKKSYRGHIHVKKSLAPKTDRPNYDEISRYPYPNQRVNDKIRASKFLKLYFYIVKIH
jgi:hypothetical protein